MSHTTQPPLTLEIPKVRRAVLRDVFDNVSDSPVTPQTPGTALARSMEHISLATTGKSKSPRVTEAYDLDTRDVPKKSKRTHSNATKRSHSSDEVVGNNENVLPPAQGELPSHGHSSSASLFAAAKASKAGTKSSATSTSFDQDAVRDGEPSDIQFLVEYVDKGNYQRMGVGKLG
jgi:hypothetical protein